MKLTLIVLIIGCSPVLLNAKPTTKLTIKPSPKEIQVDYKNLSYNVKEDSKKFVYQDKNLKKEYILKPCNKKQFEIFWGQYEANKSDLSSFSKVEEKKSLKIKEDKNKVKEINPYSKLGKFLTNLPNNLMAFEINERMKCSK